MGVNTLGPKKTQALAATTGLPIERAIVRSHNQWWIAEARCPGDIHYYVNRKTGEYEKIENPIHWTSCDKSPIRE